MEAVDYENDLIEAAQALKEEFEYTEYDITSIIRGVFR